MKVVIKRKKHSYLPQSQKNLWKYYAEQNNSLILPLIRIDRQPYFKEQIRFREMQSKQGFDETPFG